MIARVLWVRCKVMFWKIAGEWEESLTLCSPVPFSSCVSILRETCMKYKSMSWLQKGKKGGNNRDGKKYKRLEVNNSERPLEMGHKFNNIRHWSYFCLWFWLTGWLSVCFNGANVTSEFSAHINDFFQRGLKWWEILRSDLLTPIV